MANPRAPLFIQILFFSVPFLCFISGVSCDVLPDGEVHTDLHKTVEKGDELVLKCQFYGTPISVSWKRRVESTESPNLITWVEGEFTSGSCVHGGPCYMSDDFSLIIKNITVSDQGTYNCRVSNYKGHLIHNFTEVNVFSPPVEPFPLIDKCRGILPNDAEQTCSLSTSDSITITCSASSYFPDIDLFFLRESKKMGATNITEYANMDGTKNKSISIVAEPSGSPYVCVASDIPGSQDQRTVTVTVTPLESTVAMTTPSYHTTLSPSSGEVVKVVKPVIIVIALLAAISICIALIICWCRRKQQRNQRKDDPESIPLRPDPDPDPEDTMQRQLRERYVLHNNKIHIRPWDYNDTIPFEDQYINPVISMNKHKPGERGLVREQLESIDSIFVEDNGTKPKRIICVGAPGSGKSTVLNKLVLDWANKESGVSSLRKWGVSTLFSLNMGIMSENAVGNTIASQLLKGHNYNGQNIEEYIEANQKNCAILFDGLDESKFKVEDEGAINNIAQILRGEKYPDCLVIVTTRNNLEDFFASTEMSRLYMSVQIERFSDQGSKEYIERYFCHSSEVLLDKSLKDNLKYDMVLRNIISIPFFCMVVCALWEADRMASVGSLTELFNKLNMYALSRFQRERTISRNIQVTELFETTRFMGKVALENMKQNSKVASLPSEDCGEPPIPQALRTACDIGLISKKTVLLNDISAHGDTSRISYQFYHELALVQCAGAYLVSEPEILRAFLDNTITTKEQSMEYETLLRFACGSSTESCLLIMRHVFKQWKCKANSKLHRTMLYLLAEYQGNVDDQGIVDCMKECFEDQTLYLQRISQHAITGLTKFPQTSQITKLSIRSFYLSLTATQTMLKHLENLEEVLIIWASFPSTIPPVFSVRRFSIDYMRNPISYSKALGFVPCATIVNVGMGFNNRDGVVGAIAQGIAETAKSVESVSWKELTIDGYAGSGVVSFETGQELANMVGYLPHLEVLELCRVDMNEKALIAIVEKCLEITTMKEIRIGLCGSRVGGALDTHLMHSLGQVGGGIIITVYHYLKYGAKIKRSYRVKHFKPSSPPKSKRYALLV